MTGTQSIYLLDIISVSISLAILIGYNVYYYVFMLYFRNIKKPQSKARLVTLGARIKIATSWLERHLIGENPVSITLALQTIHNTIIVAIFVGGYAINFAFLYMNKIDLATTLPAQMRSLILAILLFCSFLAWASVIGLGSHLGYIIGVSSVWPIPSAATNGSNNNNNDYTSNGDISNNNSNNNSNNISNNDFTSVAGCLDIGGQIGRLNQDQDQDKDAETGGDGEDGDNNNNNNSTGSSTGNSSNSSSGYDDALIQRTRKLRSRYISTKMMLSFSLGFRFMFLSIPFVFYSFGCASLLIATALIMVFLLSIDHTENVELD